MFSGSIPALVTPMLTNGEIDYRAWADLIEWHCQAGSAGIVVLGTTGESATINNDERGKLIQIAVERAQKRLPVIVGTGTNCTKTSIELTQSAQALGADGALVVTPYYNKPTQTGLMAHFSSIADQVDLPIILYNVPGRTGVDLDENTVLRLSEKCRNIVALKDATGDLTRLIKMRTLLRNKNATLSLLSGDDATSADFILQGGQGMISVTANIIPQEMATMVAAALNGKADQALEIHQRCAALNKALFVESNPIPCKWLLAMMQRIGEGIRLPLTSLSEGKQKQVADCAKQLGLLECIK